MIVIVVLKSCTSGHWLRGCHECPLWLPRAARHASHCELFCGHSGWIKPQCPKGFSFPDQNKGLRADRAAPHKSQVGFFVAVRAQEREAAQNRTKHKMHKLQHKVASCVFSALGSTKTARKPLNCPKQKQNSQLSAPYKSSHQTYQLLTPNKTSNSPQNYHPPAILSHVNFHQNDQLQTQGRCGC